MGTKAPVFVREATGLIRSMSARDMFFLNFTYFGGAWSIIYAVEYAPLYGGDPIASLFLTLPGILAIMGVFYIFLVSMPRTGGDYVFISRVLHPAIGLAANFAGVAMFQWFWIGDGATVFSSQGLAQMLSVYGYFTGQQWAINAAGAFTPMTTFILGTVAIIIFTTLVIFSSRIYFWIQNIAMVLAIVAILLIIGLLATTSQTSFASILNNYATAQGVSLSHGAYGNFTATGQSYWGGPTPTATSSGFTFMLVPLWFTVLFWVYASSYLGGETKNVSRSGLVAMFGNVAMVFVFLIAVFGFSYLNLGADFLGGAGYYALGYATNPLPILPNLTLFAVLLTNSPALVLVIGIGVVAGFLLVIGQTNLILSRMIFGYAFDRVAPSFIANVNEKSHTPAYALIIGAIGGEIFLLFLSGVVGPSTAATAFLTYSYAALGTAFMFIFLSVSAIVFPYRKKSLYETSCPVKRKIAGLPVLSWLGIIALCYSLITLGYYSYNYTFYFGAGTLAAALYFPFLGTVAAIFIGCIVWFYVVKSIRSRGGIPFEKAFQEIPPE